MTNVLVEGGAHVFGSFFDADLVDEVHVFIAPRLLGGDGLAAVVGRGVDRMSEALRMAHWEHEAVGDDFYLHGYLRQSEQFLKSLA